MKKYGIVTAILIGIVAYCWAETYRYPEAGTCPGKTLIIIVGEDVTFEEAVALQERNCELEEQLQAARQEIEGLKGRMGRAVDDLAVVKDYLTVSGPDVAGMQSETPAQNPLIGPGWKIYREGDRVLLYENTVLHW
ncbi:MAG TPA: hypothetical protein PK360_00090 [bacterium]|nr:hypothetical protein [bacterium]